MAKCCCVSNALSWSGDMATTLLPGTPPFPPKLAATRTGDEVNEKMTNQSKIFAKLNNVEQ